MLPTIPPTYPSDFKFVFCTKQLMMLLPAYAAPTKPPVEAALSTVELPEVTEQLEMIPERVPVIKPTPVDDVPESIIGVEQFIRCKFLTVPYWPTLPNIPVTLPECFM